MKRGKSILSRLMVLLLVVLLVQMGIYFAVFMGGGVTRAAENNAFSIFDERTENRKLYLENEMVERWSSTREAESEILEVVRTVLEEHGAAISDLEGDAALCQEIVSRAASGVIDLLRRNGTTGAFLVLDCPREGNTYPGFYVRDYDPTSFSEGNADLLMERGLPEVARDNAIAMDSYWSAFFRFDSPEASSSFYFTPVLAARSAAATQRNSKYYYRWSDRFALSKTDQDIVTYSTPLIWEDGTVLGVLGVGITAEYLSSQLKYQELDESRTGAYYLGISRDGGKSYAKVCGRGPNFESYFGTEETLTVAPTVFQNIVTLTGAGKREGGHTLYGAVQPLKLYSPNTPFVEEQWALIGIMEGESLLNFPKHLGNLLILSMVLSLVIGFSLMAMAARALASPIITLAADLRRSNPEKAIKLKRIHITEIDALTDAIENLSNAAAESASRTSKIIAMTQVPIGVFEYSERQCRFFCSQNLFTIMNWPEAGQGDLYLEQEKFKARMEKAIISAYDRRENIYQIMSPDGGDHWIQISYRIEGKAVLGAVQDVTRDVEAKRKIEYERDFDILTDLLNRRAFDSHLEQMFRPEEKDVLGVAALLMFDLDNLKFVNDTFGHDYGDRYIQAFAKSLEYFRRCRSEVSRRSGDEFNVFLYGYASQDEIRALVRTFWIGLEGETILLPNGKNIRVRASGGLAWYPGDSDSYEELLRLADFAMYDIKHTVKGALREFDKKDYAEKGILIQGQDALNRLIDNRLVRYAFQPIVSAEDGRVIGHELLMRPLVEQLSKLNDLFRLAKAESKLYQMERLTWFEAVAAFARQILAGKLNSGELAFINSLGGQCLTDADVEQLEERYGDLLSRVVIEFTESEEMNAAAIRYKQKKARDWNAKIALDDYGTGYNGNAILLEVTPDIVKVDISIISGIDRNPGKLAVLRALISFAQERGIKILAEGVETAGEMETVVRAGVHYLQGYYLARPNFEPPDVPSDVVEQLLRIRESMENGMIE